MVTTYHFRIENYGIEIEILVERVTTEYMRFLKILDRIEHPMDKKVYGFNLIKKHLIIKRLSDGYYISLPLINRITPTEKTLTLGVMPLTGTELQAAKKSFKQFHREKGVFYNGIHLPVVKSKVLTTQLIS